MRPRGRPYPRPKGRTEMARTGFLGEFSLKQGFPIVCSEKKVGFLLRTALFELGQARNAPIPVRLWSRMGLNSMRG